MKMFKNLIFSPYFLKIDFKRCISSSTASITRTHRAIYCRMYPTIVVQPNGSSITIRYPEPRKIIKLPLDINTLSESEKKARMEARKPRKRIQIEQEVDDSFNSKKYLKYIRNKK